MKKVFIILETWNEETSSVGYVNTVWEDLESAKSMAKRLQEDVADGLYYRNWIISRPLL